MGGLSSEFLSWETWTAPPGSREGARALVPGLPRRPSHSPAPKRPARGPSRRPWGVVRTVHGSSARTAGGCARASATLLPRVAACRTHASTRPTLCDRPSALSFHQANEFRHLVHGRNDFAPRAQLSCSTLETPPRLLGRRRSLPFSKLFRCLPHNGADDRRVPPPRERSSAPLLIPEVPQRRVPALRALARVHHAAPSHQPLANKEASPGPRGARSWAAHAWPRLPAPPAQPRAERTGRCAPN